MVYVGPGSGVGGLGSLGGLLGRSLLGNRSVLGSGRRGVVLHWGTTCEDRGVLLGLRLQRAGDDEEATPAGTSTAAAVARAAAVVAVCAWCTRKRI